MEYFHNLAALSIIEQLLNHIDQYHPLGAPARSAILDCFEQLILPKGELLATEGKTCRSLFFLEQGAVRGYYHLDGKEVTHWFAFENDFVTSFHSFITRQPAIENIQLNEGCVLWAVSRDRLDTLLDRFHEIERLVRIIYETYYLRLEERYVNAQFKTATERYQELLEQRPYLLERVSLGHIASFLGISAETLSRIRKPA